MKKSKIFMATATAVLAIVAVFATKANKKFFTAISTAYIGASTSGWYLKDATTLLTTISGTPRLKIDLFYTVSGVYHEVSAASGILSDGDNLGHPAYYNTNF
jgi:hypothetical protein